MTTPNPLDKSTVTGMGATPTWWRMFTGADRSALDNTPVGSPLWMLLRGLSRLNAERPEVERLEAYWQGRHDAPDTLDDDTAAKYVKLVDESGINYMRTVVEVIAERIKLQGLWLPGDDERADSETWKLWTENGLDSWQGVAWPEMLAKRRVYWSVWPTEDGQPPRIEIEDALQTWVELEQGSRTRRAFAVKTFVDDWTGEEVADVVTPTAVHYFIRQASTGRQSVVERTSDKSGGKEWVERQPSEPNKLGEVPFVAMVNKPTLRGPDRGYSVIEDVTKTQDRLNQTILGRMLAGHTAAFLQKYATGIEVEDDDDGNPVPPFKPGVTRLWISENESAKFGQFDATDLRNYITGEEQEIQHIANTTRLPRHYLNPTGQAPSGDAMRSAEAALVALVTGVQQFCEAPLREVFRLARSAAGIGETPFESELVWADPEFQTYGQLVDGTTKLVQGGIASKRWAREKVGMTPATIRRVEAELQAELLEAAALAEEEADRETRSAVAVAEATAAAEPEAPADAPVA
jgi:hypothetical protein